MPVTTSAVAAANRIQGLGNDYISTESSGSSNISQASSYLSSLVSNIHTSVMGDGLDAKYEGKLNSCCWWWWCWWRW